MQAAESARERQAAPGQPYVWRRLRYRIASLQQSFENAVWDAWTGAVRAGRVRGWRFTATGLGVGVVVVAAAREMVAAGVDADNWWARVSALLAAVVVLAVVTALMLLWYMRHRANQDDLFPMLSAIVLSVVAAGLTLVTFAGAATVVWDAGYASLPHGPAASSYSLVERSYLWTLAGSVPVLALPDRFGWGDPLPLAGFGPDLVRLGYRFMLLVLLIRVAQAGYAAAKSRWLSAHDRQAALLAQTNQDLVQEPEWTGTPAISTAVAGEPASSLPAWQSWRLPVWRQAWARWLGMQPGRQLTLAALAIAAVAGSSYLPRLPGLVHGWWLAGAAEFTAAWAARVLPWLLAAWLVRRWCLVIPWRSRNLAGLPLARVTGLSLAWIAQIIAAAAAVLALLVRSGIVTVTPASGGGRRLLGLLAWELANAMPGPSITAAMHWNRPGVVRGPAAALVEVAMLLSVLALLAFPVARAVHVWSRRAAQWEDPDLPEPEHAAGAALSTAAHVLSTADRAVYNLAVYVQQRPHTRYAIQRYQSFPWGPGTGQFGHTGRFAFTLRSLTGSLPQHERQVSAMVSAAERALRHMQDTRAALRAAGVGEVLVKAYDAAAAAIRRHYLFFYVDDPRHARGFLTTRRPAPRTAEALARVDERAAAAADGFAALLDPPARHEHLPWQEIPVTMLGGRLTSVPSPELLKTATSKRFRRRWDFPVRMPMVLAAVAARPPAEVVTFMTGLLSAERDDFRGPWRVPDATLRLLDLIYDQGDQRVADVVAALLAGHERARQGRGQTDSRMCADWLIAPYRDAPTPVAVRLFLRLSEVGCTDFAIEELLRDRLHSAREMSIALETLREAGRDDLRSRVLSLAAQWPVGETGGELVRLIRTLREDDVPPAELLIPLGRNVRRPTVLREHLAAELRQSSLNENQWMPLLLPASSLP